MLTEDEVIDAVVAHPEKTSWAIESRPHAGEHGEDVAIHNDQHLAIEARGR